MNAYEKFQLEKYGNILCEDGFTKDVMPVNQQEDEDNFSIDLSDHYKAWFEFEAQMQLWNDESNFPQSYK